jgi:hypothetical protein
VLNPPIAYDENAINGQKFWGPDPSDGLLPQQKGFLTDLVYAYRGTEIPTLFTLWSGLWAIAAAVRREAWVKWFPGRFYANLYVILVGTPGLVKKSSAANIVTDLLANLPDYIDDPNMKRIKKINLLRGKATPESLMEAMIPIGSRVYLEDADGNRVVNPKTNRPLYYAPGSEIAISSSELATLLSKQKYSENLTSDLLDFYDCHNVWPWRTVKRGVIELRNLHTCFLGASTPKGFQRSLPDAVLGDGFLSRCVIVAQLENPRTFAQPRPVSGAPDQQELGRRLGYIASTMNKEHEFSPGAWQLYEHWYLKHKEKLRRELSDDNLGINSRLDINVQKVAFLMKAQRYTEPEDRTIQLGDLEDSIRLLEGTFARAPSVLRGVIDDAFSRTVNKVETFLRRKKNCLRQEVLSGLRMSAVELDPIIEELRREGSIRIIESEKSQKRSGKPLKSEERYVWNEYETAQRAAEVN